MNESTITTLFKGEYVQVDLVDETIELTVENNVYSYSESYELLDELQKACTVSREANSMTTYSQEMQNKLEPIDEPLDSKSKLHDQTGAMSSGYYESYLNNLPRLTEGLEDEVPN